MMPHAFPFGCLILASLVGSSSLRAAEVDFAKEIQPLFERSCFSCHGPTKQRANLRLDTVDGIREGSDSGPVFTAGKSATSKIVQALRGSDDVSIMPPKEPRLTKDEIALVARWIDEGAKLPKVIAKSKATPELWSLKPIPEVALPTVKEKSWVQNPLDMFVLARLDKEGIRPSPEADRRTLIRRLSLDLTGLPPTPAEIQAFLDDKSSKAMENVVDRLLASRHYGERWGRHWLDLARYADSNGYSIDSPRSIWPYRDWVINALNSDMPFDRFTIEQLAGDLLPGATLEQKIATGFHRNTQINEEGGIDPEQFRVEAVVDRVNTTGSVWLGLTVACCQCHNHKFDPLSQREYYQLFAFFNNQDEPTLTVKAAPPSPKEAKEPKDPKAKPKKKPDGSITTMVLAERKQPRTTNIMLGGDFTRLGLKVTSGTPSVLPSLAAKENATRLDLARWLVDPKNPLTSRVTVNRIWGVYFGTGLVETENDFGTQGSLPSHPELLDWLASQFVKEGWSLKKLHKLIVMSATYRQSSKVRPDLETLDPRNRLLARQSRLRLDAELVRDVNLAASGLLNPKVGGPSVYPPQPEGVFRFTQVSRQWSPSEGAERYRRGMYTYFWRAAPHPALMSFDAPDAGTACTRRNRSNTPLQALTLLNDAGFTEYAAGLANRLIQEKKTTSSEAIDQAFVVTLGRLPSAPEKSRLTAFFDKQKGSYNATQATTTLKGAGPAGKELLERKEVAEADKLALFHLARVVLNLDESITRE